MGLRFWGLVIGGAVPAAVLAGTAASNGVPEPDVFALLAAGAVGLAAVIRARKR